MSEYQYYEFRSIDRALSADEMDELKSVSSRAEITSTSFTNEYHYGDFRGNPEELTSQYFDAFVYVANWGTRRLMFRLPRRLFDLDVAKSYCDGEALKVVRKRTHVLLEFSSDDEGGGWEEGQGWMESLVPLRAAVMRGDYRALYLGWLASFASRGWFDASELGDDRDVKEPPVPPGLAKLTPPLKALADFLRLDDTLIEAASVVDTGEAVPEPSKEQMARWLKKVPAAKKEAYLLRFIAAEEDEALRAELIQQYHLETRRPSTRMKGPKRRTVGALLTARDALDEAAEKGSVSRNR